MVEADNMSEAELAIKAKPDIIQLDKFSPQQILEALNLAAQQGFRGATHCRWRYQPQQHPGLCSHGSTRAIDILPGLKAGDSYGAQVRH